MPQKVKVKNGNASNANPSWDVNPRLSSPGVFLQDSRMLFFRRWLAFLLAALAWSGCSSSNPSKPAAVLRKPLLLAPVPVRMAPQPTVTNVHPPLAKGSLGVLTNAVAETNAAVPKTTVSTNPPTDAHPHPEINLRNAFRANMPQWVEMGQWSTDEGVRLVSQAASGPKRFELHSNRGDLVLVNGSQTAYWNGQALMLSFAPQLSNNHPYLHRADLQHTVSPLLCKCVCGPHEGKVLVIDPGHGGDQSGSRTVVGKQLEKDLTLDWALRARALLANEGWRVFLTRTNDVDVSLSNRVAVAESLHADLFISLHFNSFSNSEYAGIETYCMTPAGMPSNLVRGSEDHMALPNNAYDDENLCWAVRLHESLVRDTLAPDRGVRRARFMAVLRNQKCPAVLIEGGYLSNRKEAAKLITGAYREQLAEALVKALARHE